MKLVELFPGIVAIARKKLVELKQEYVKVEELCQKELDQMLFEHQTKDERMLNLIKEIAFLPLHGDNSDLGEIKGLDHEIAHWEKIVRIDEWKRQPVGDDTITDIDIAQAKEIPITNFIEVNRAGFTKCPFHNEKTGSFKVYPQDNRWHCFGLCYNGGDVIDLICKMNNLTFIEAVKFLINK